MAMKINRKFLRGEPLERWAAYGPDGFELLLVYPRPAEWQAFSAGRELSAVPSDDFARFLAQHVKEWRGIEDEDGAPIECSPDVVAVFARDDRAFGVWLTAQLLDAASFRCPARDGASGPAGSQIAPTAEQHA